MAAEVLTARPSTAIEADQFGKISPANFRGGAVAGLNAGENDAPDEVGFLFKLTDAAGQVAINTATTTGRDDIAVSVVTDLGKAINIAAMLSNSGGTPPRAAGDLVYVDIQQESSFASRRLPDRWQHDRRPDRRRPGR